MGGVGRDGAHAASCCGRGELGGHRSLLRAAHDRQVELAGVRDLVERLVEGIDARQVAAGGADQQVAALDAGAGGRAAVLDTAHQQSLALGQPDGAAHPARHPRRGDRDPEPRSLRRLAATQPRRALLDGRGGRHREDQAAVETQGVQPQQASLGVHERTARRAARERSGVLDRSADPAPARTAEAAALRRDEAERDPQAAPARVGERQHRGAEARRVGRLPGDRRSVAGVDGEYREVEIGVGAGHLARWPAGRPRRRRSPARGAGCGRS